MAAIGGVKVSGTVEASPVMSGDTVVPSGVTSILFNLFTVPKAFGAATGAQSATIASPSAFVELAGVHTTRGPVTRGNFFFMRTTAAMDVRVTQLNPAGGVLTYTQTQVKGIFAIEFDNLAALTLVEVKGTGTIEWFASGDV